VATRGVHGLADRFRHFVRLARRHAHLPLPVADGDQRVEAEPTAALDDLRDAVDGDHVLDEIGPLAILLRRVVTATAATAFAAAPALTATPARTTRTAATGATRAPATTTAARTAASAATARGPTTESTTLFSHLELQPAFAGSVGHRLH